MGKIAGPPGPRLNRPGARRTRVGNASLFRVHEGDGGVEHPVGEAPFVVVPGADLHERAFGHLGERPVEDRRGGACWWYDKDA